MNPLQATLDALEDGLKCFGRYFDPPIRTDPLLLLVPAGRRHMKGWTGLRCWHDVHLVECSGCRPGAGVATHQEATREHPATRTEIVLCSEYLLEGLDCLGTLLHEMVHYANQERGVADCSRRQYHNRKFKGLAEQVGLETQCVAGRGWASTSWRLDSPAYADARAVLQRHPKAFQYAYHPTPPARPARSRPYWTCRCRTGGRVLAARSFSAVCRECGHIFTRQAGDR